MKLKRYKSTKTKSSDQEMVAEETKEAFDFLKSSFLGTLIVILSGIIIYSDKIIVALDLNFPMPSRYERYDFETFIWSVSVTVSPLLLILAAHMKTKLVAYVVPLYSYTLQFWFIIYDLAIVDKGYTYFYALGTSILVFFVWLAYNKQEKQSLIKKYKEVKERLLSEE